MWSSHRENQRWQRERDDRRGQWQRERQARQEQWQREDSLRWHQDRQQTYARFLSALYEWDARLNGALASRLNDAALNERTDIDATEIDHARRTAREQLPLVLFMAPKQTRDLATSAVRRRETFWVIHLTPDVIDVNELEAAWRKVLDSMNSLLRAMRNDLGLEIAIEDTDTAHATDEEAQPKVPPPEGEGTPRSPEGS
jgi:hypothetical protein